MTHSRPELHLITRGDGERAILLLHGGGVAGWMWHPLAAHLETANRLLIPDLPGHDRSAAIPYRSHDDTVDLLARAVREQATAPVTVIGFSLGAQLAVLLAARHPELVRAVGVISAQARPVRFQAATLALLRMAAPLARNERFARLQARELFVPDALMDDYVRTSGGITAQTLVASVGENLRFTIPPGWASFPGRSLILVGAAERRLMTASAQDLAAAHTHSELEIVAGCGHGIPLQRPDWLAQRIAALVHG